MFTLVCSYLKTLPYDLLDLAETLSSDVANEPGYKLRSALDDYTNVCDRLEDNGMSPGERAEWDEIRSELVTEIIRLTDRLGKNSNRRGY